MDLDAELPQLAVEQAGGDTVAREAGGLVDDDGVEAPRGGIARFLGQGGPSGPVVLRARFLIEELDHHLAAQLGGLALAGLQLRRPGEGLVLLVVGRQAAVERESSDHGRSTSRPGLDLVEQRFGVCEGRDDNHPGFLMLELDTAAADRPTAAMDADPHLGAPGACVTASKAISLCRRDRSAAVGGIRLSGTAASISPPSGSTLGTAAPMSLRICRTSFLIGA